MRALSLLIALPVLLAACASSPPPPPSSPPPPPYQAPQPPPYQAPQPPPAMSLHDRVHDALTRQMGSAASGITLRVEGSKVYLSGHVGSQSDHSRAHDIAHGVSGVTSVDKSGLVVH